MEEEKSRLVQLAQQYAGTHHPLGYAQSQWLDQLLNLLWHSGASSIGTALST
ncbi:aspartyl-phosphate phosphatase Spo0E family protein [Paradesulfitobacterium aromaticivorans]